MKDTVLGQPYLDLFFYTLNLFNIIFAGVHMCIQYIDI